MKVLARLFLLFTVVAAVELYLLLKLAELTSWWLTVPLILVPGFVGAWLARREGRRALAGIRDAMSLTREPTGAILDAGLVVVAATLMITPGVLTDLAGLALLVPPVRRVVREYARARLRRAVDKRVASGGIRVGDLADLARGRGSYEVIDSEDIPKRR